jgi:hypothetical protein
MKLEAYISIDEKYRYILSRTWDDSLPFVTFICLNPSTADAKQDDPTSLKCIKYAKRWGMGGMFIVNLFAFRDTHQRQLWEVENPVGEENNDFLKKSVGKSSLVVAAWGNCRTSQSRQRAIDVCKMFPNLHCLRVNITGDPHHPLYLSDHIQPQPYIRNG